MTRYFDHNATTPLCGEAREEMTRLLSAMEGNPSSIHAQGRAARTIVETARADIATLAGAPPEAVVLTSGGSEAIALGLVGLARRSNRRRVLIGASEHPGVHGAAELLAKEGYTIETLAVDAAGRVDVAGARIDDGVAVVAIQAANHETGVLQPVDEIADAARAVGAFVLCDAVQAAGKCELPTGASALCIASHKIYGPKGAGALVLARGVDIEALVPGGHQERGRRAGTEPVLILAGFGAAARVAQKDFASEAARQIALRERLECGLERLGARIFGADLPRTPNTTMCAFDRVPGQLLVMALDLEGYALSTGAACSSGSVAPSAVLLAAGHDRQVALRSLRISLGRDTGESDVDDLLSTLPPVLTRIRSA